MCSQDMKDAYRISSRAVREKMRKDKPLDEEYLNKVNRSDVVVVGGQYDRVQDVLDAMEIPHMTVSPRDVDEIKLNPSQVIFINCPGNLTRDGITKIRQFVEEGGFLVTTDWALKHVIEPAFPGIMRYNERPTKDDVVRIEILDGGHKFLEGLMSSDEDPQWWLEGSSYPIEVLDHEKVEILISSKEMKEKYGEAPVAVTFKYGEGSVFHIVSHYYLQRSELRTKRHKSPSPIYFEEKGIAATAEMDDVSLGAAESAYTSASFISKVIIEKKKRS